MCDADLVELKGKMKEINKQSRQWIDLKTQENLMVGVIFCCIVAMVFLYLMVISR
jgi:hypothetical protein